MDVDLDSGYFLLDGREIWHGIGVDGFDDGITVVGDESIYKLGLCG
jgi:hypothetical protein